MKMPEERTMRSSYKTWQTDKAKLMADFFGPGQSQHLIMHKVLASFAAASSHCALITSCNYT